MNPMYEIESIWTFDEYRKFNRTLVNEHKIIKLLNIIFLGLSFYIVITMGIVTYRRADTLQEFMRVFFISLSFLVLLGVVFVLGYKRIMLIGLKKEYETNKNTLESMTIIKFFRNYIEILNVDGVLKLTYDKLYKIIETDTNFYLMTTKYIGYNFIKAKCSSDIQVFFKLLKIKVIKSERTIV